MCDISSAPKHANSLKYLYRPKSNGTVLSYTHLDPTEYAIWAEHEKRQNHRSPLQQAGISKVIKNLFPPYTWYPKKQHTQRSVYPTITQASGYNILNHKTKFKILYLLYTTGKSQMKVLEWMKKIMSLIRDLHDLHVPATNCIYSLMIPLTFSCRSTSLLKKLFFIFRHGCFVHSTTFIHFIYLHQSHPKYCRHTGFCFSCCFVTVRVFAVYLHFRRTCAQHKLMQMAFSVGTEGYASRDWLSEYSLQKCSLYFSN